MGGASAAWAQKLDGKEVVTAEGSPLPRPQLWALGAAAAGCLPVKAGRLGHLRGVPAKQ